MRRRWLLSLLVACGGAALAIGAALGAASGSGRAALRAGGLELVQIGDFVRPIGIASAPGDPRRLYIVQQGGQVILIRDGRRQAQPFLDISSLVNSTGNEQGLIGLAFSPHYASNGLFYVDYTIADNDIRIVQYRRSATNPNIADPSSAKLVLAIDHHLYNNHNGGQLAFGPDGDLYIGVGDGGSEGDPDNNGQNTDTLLGKLLRIDPRPTGGYTIPPSNPFVGERHRRPEIWAYGLRNPWRFSFDRTTGALIVGDVGQDLEEEIDYQPAGTGAGANYGWSVWEGDRRNKPGVAAHAVFPALVALHSDGYCAIIGGYVVRDPTLPSLYGRYLFGDNCRPQIESVVLSRGHARGLRATGLQVQGTTSFGEGASGHIYIASLNGPVYRLVKG
jgi:glucose/arabinose dehydrogenase